MTPHKDLPHDAIENLRNSSLAAGMEVGLEQDRQIAASDSSGSVAEAIGAHALTPSASSGLAILLDVAAQCVQLTATLGLALSLAGVLCIALVASSRQFSESARSSRNAVQATSIQSLAEQLRTVTGHAKPTRNREQMVRDINQRALTRGK